MEYALHIDGTRIYQTPEQERAEFEVAQYVAKCTKSIVSKFSKLSPIDWYAQRYDRLAGVLELKDREHPTTKYNTVYLSVRKWMALLMAQNGLGIPGIFVARFTDGPVLWIRATDVKPNKTIRILGAPDDKEPMIDVPLADMKPFTEAA